MIRKTVHLINTILLAAVLLTIGSCDRHGVTWEKLDMAESLMDSKPDSAFVVRSSKPSDYPYQW